MIKRKSVLSRAGIEAYQHPASQQLFYGWRVVAACFAIAAVAWSLGLFGSSVYLHAVTAAHGWPISQVSSAITLFFFVSAMIQRVVSRGIDHWGPRPLLLIGSVSMTAGVALIGRVTEPWQLYPCFFLLGIGWSALSTTGIATTVAPWFERYQGRSMTLAIMGASVGAIVGVPLLLLSVAALGLSSGLMAAAAIGAVVLVPLVAVVLRYRGPADIGQQPDGEALVSCGATVIPPLLATPANRRQLLWSTAVAFALALMIQIGFITHHVAVAEPLLGAAGAGLLVSATGGVALIGRLILARIVDDVRVRHLACLVMIAQSAALLAISLWPIAPVLIVASLIYGYGIGHVTTLSPVIVRREFGAAAFGAAYGMAATVIQLISASGPALFGFMHDGFGDYRPGFLIAAAVTMVGCASLFLGGRSAR